MGVATTTTEATMSSIHESLAQLSVKLGRIAVRQEEMLVDLKKTTAALMPNGAIATTTPIFEPGRVLEQQTTKPSSSSLFSASQVVGSGARLADAVIAAAMPTGCSTKGHGHYIDKGRAELVSPSWGNTQAEVRVPCEPSLDRSPQPCVAHKLSMSTTPTHLTKCILDNTNVQSSAVVEEATPGLSMNAALLNDTALGCTLPATALSVGRDTCNTAQTLDGMVEEEVFTTVGGLSLFSELCVDASVPWDPGTHEDMVHGVLSLLRQAGGGLTISQRFGTEMRRAMTIRQYQNSVDCDCFAQFGCYLALGARCLGYALLPCTNQHTIQNYMQMGQGFAVILFLVLQSIYNCKKLWLLKCVARKFQWRSWNRGVHKQLVKEVVQPKVAQHSEWMNISCQSLVHAVCTWALYWNHIGDYRRPTILICNNHWSGLLIQKSEEWCCIYSDVEATYFQFQARNQLVFSEIGNWHLASRSFGNFSMIWLIYVHKGLSNCCDFLFLHPSGKPFSVQAVGSRGFLVTK